MAWMSGSSSTTRMRLRVSVATRLHSRPRPGRNGSRPRSFHRGPLPLLDRDGRPLADLGADVELVHQAPDPGQAEARAAALRHRARRIGDAGPLVAGLDDDAEVLAEADAADGDPSLPRVLD